MDSSEEVDDGLVRTAVMKKSREESGEGEK